MYKILIFATVAALCACGGNTQKRVAVEEADTVVVDMHNAENSLDYIGTYKGTLPAADCPGIETTLELMGDGTYKLISKYIDRDSSFEDAGTYTVNGNLLTLQTDGVSSCYKIEENRLRMLDGDKQEITGELAPYYVLTKTN